MRQKNTLVEISAMNDCVLKKFNYKDECKGNFGKYKYNFSLY